jgi:hypothetical protein
MKLQLLLAVAFAVTVGLVTGFAVPTPASTPSAAAAQEGTCVCAITANVTTYQNPPPCYYGTWYVLTKDNGRCGSALCTLSENCAYAISIYVDAQSDATCAEFRIDWTDYLFATTTVAACTVCGHLEYHNDRHSMPCYAPYTPAYEEFTVRARQSSGGALVLVWKLRVTCEVCPL